MVAPLTNLQSHADGTLSDDEYRWLTMRAAGGFGITMTCASHVLAAGQGFPGQLGCFSHDHLAGLTRLAAGLRQEGSLALVQLHHAGRRSPVDLIATTPVAPSDDASTGARALSNDDVHGVVDAFVAAARRCQVAGFDGVEIHGAHDYLVCEFLSREVNQRTDEYGGSVENRARFLREIVAGVRAACGEQFNVSVRLSPELFGLTTSDIIETYDLLVDDGQLDFIDMSMWNVFTTPVDETLGERTLLEIFAERERRGTALAVAGKLYDATEMQRCLDAGADIVALGRAAITNHNFPQLAERDATVAMRERPVPRTVLAEEGLSETFLNYMSSWKGFVGDDADKEATA
jgi:2,4-dienoyl-CoA reductase-like NADH-dependent reductase (Old Yellow Enzyme family)